MLEDLISEELEKDEELIKLLYGQNELDEKIENLEIKAEKNYKRNLRLVITSIISEFLTVGLFFTFHISLLPSIMIGYALHKSSKILEKDYYEDAKKINRLIDRYNNMTDKKVQIVRNIATKIINTLNLRATEVANLIRDYKFDEILKNYELYKDIISLLNDDYSLILLMLITYGENGIKSIDELDDNNKSILYYTAQSTLGRENPVKEIKIEDLIIEEDEEEIEEKGKTYTKKRPN